MEAGGGGVAGDALQLLVVLLRLAPRLRLLLSESASLTGQSRAGGLTVGVGGVGPTWAIMRLTGLVELEERREAQSELEASRLREASRTRHSPLSLLL